MNKTEVTIPIGDSHISGNLNLIKDSKGIIVFAHGSGSSRFSKRNQFVAHELNTSSFSTFLFDLLTPEEESVDEATREFRFNIPLLAERLVLVTKWIKDNAQTSHFRIGYFGSSTGAAATLIAAVQLPQDIAAIVSRGGRPDLAQDYLSQVKAPTLLIIGELDDEVIALNKQAYDQLSCKKNMILIPSATHLFEEEGTLEEVTKYAIDWYKIYI